MSSDKQAACVGKDCRRRGDPEKENVDYSAAFPENVDYSAAFLKMKNVIPSTVSV